MAFKDPRARASARALFSKEHLISTRKTALVVGASTVSLAALIVFKMVALDWVGRKLQDRFGRN